MYKDQNKSSRESNGLASNFPDNNEGLIQRCPVVIGTIDCTYTGYIICFRYERLLDVLNKGSVCAQPDLPADFLQIYETRVCSLDRQNDLTSRCCLIGKQGILYVAENTLTDTKKSQSISGDRSLYKITKPVSVEIHMPGLSVTGLSYIEPWQHLTGAIDDNRQFVPVTNALLTRPGFGAAELEFVAINRKYISFLSRLD